jgi:hypothetical protein
MESRGATVDGYGMPGSTVIGNGFLEKLDTRSLREPVRTEHVDNGLNILF